jgi:hypothetical protein
LPGCNRDGTILVVNCVKVLFLLMLSTHFDKIIQQRRTERSTVCTLRTLVQDVDLQSSTVDSYQFMLPFMRRLTI